MASRSGVFGDHGFSIRRLIGYKETAADTDADMLNATSSASVRIAMLTPSI